MIRASLRRHYSEFCKIPPHPDYIKRLYKEYKQLKKKNKRLTELQFLISKGLFRKPQLGLDDNTQIDPEQPIAPGAI
jgi:hypothetical protein